jgi:hypothetical protein
LRGIFEHMLGESQNALNVYFLELSIMQFHAGKRDLLAEPVSLTVVRLCVDPALVNEGVLEDSFTFL